MIKADLPGILRKEYCSKKSENKVLDQNKKTKEECISELTEIIWGWFHLPDHDGFKPYTYNLMKSLVEEIYKWHIENVDK